MHLLTSKFPIAEMGELYKQDEYDLGGTANGAIERGKKTLPNMDTMQPGDVLLGLASSGCHSNGFSLIRKVIDRAGLTFSDMAPWGQGKTIGEDLLTPTRIYVKPIFRAVKQNLIKGMAHITGGGLLENVPRMLPKHLSAELDATTWPVPAVFRWLKTEGRIEDDEFARVFNTGLGMVLIVGQADVEKAVEELRGAGETVFVVGRLVEREGEGCVVKSMEVWH